MAILSDSRHYRILSISLIERFLAGLYLGRLVVLNEMGA